MPAACAHPENRGVHNGDEGSRLKCRLHMALHGCSQQGDTDFMYKTGYWQWADLNNIVVLFPQTSGSYWNPMNPLGCWDFWAFGDSSHSGNYMPYLTKQGGQLTVLRKIVEKAAGLITCAATNFACTNLDYSLSCMDNAWKCDDEQDCLDNSDEAGCRTPISCAADTQFACKDGFQCVDAAYHCDAKQQKDCRDGSDELDCPPPPTPPFSCPARYGMPSSMWFPCSSRSKCIRLAWKCDGMNDCGDNSDEQGC